MASNRIKGITIEIGGDTTGLDKALKDVNKSVNSTRKELSEINKALDLNPGNADLIAQRQRALGEAVSATAQKFNMLSDAQKQAQQQLANGSINQSQYDALTRELIKAETEYKNISKEAALAGVAINNSGSSVNSASSYFATLGARCTELGQKMQAVSAAAMAVAGGLVAMATSAASTADEIATIAKQTGLSTAEVQSLQYAAEQLDVPFNSVQSAITRMKSNLNGTRDAFKDIGVEVVGQNGHLKDTNEIFFESIKALSNIKNETEKDAAAMKLFGKNADELAGLIDDGGAALSRLSQQAQEKGMIISDEDINKANEFKDALDGVKTQMKAAFASAGVQVASALLPIIQDLAGAASRLAAIIANLPEPVLKIIAVLSIIVGLAAPILMIVGQMATGISALINVSSQLAPAIANIASAFGTAISTISAFVAANAGTLGIIALIAAAVVLLGVAIYEVATHWDKIKEATANATNSMKASIEGSQLGQHLQNQFDAMRSFATSGLDEIKSAFSNSSSTIAGVWNAGLETIHQVTRTVIRSMTGATENQMDSMASHISSIWGKISSAISSEWNSIINNTRSRANAFVSGIVNAIKDLPNKVKQALSNMKQALVDKISKPFEDIVNKAQTWGKDLIDNFVGGLTGNSGTLESSIQKIAQTIDDNIGFSEPKKGPLSDFHKNAPDMIDLWVKGIKENMYKVTRATTSLATSMNPGTANVSEKSAQTFVGGSTSTLNVYVDHISELSDLVRIQNQAQQRNRMGARA